MQKLNDLTGQRFGRLTVLERTEDYVSPKGQHAAKWLCQCDCGNKIEIVGLKLKNGNTQSCGCLRESLHDLTGQRFGNLVALKRAEDYVSPKGQHLPRWLCQCDCGNQIEVLSSKLRDGSIQSCGCMKVNKLDPIIGQRFGKLVVLERAENYVSPKGKQHKRWLCQCDCGNKIIVMANKLKTGTTQSCGCLRREFAEHNFGNLVGKRFGKLVVLKRVENYVSPKGRKVSKWLCQCDCGNQIEVIGNKLKMGVVKSCGCKSATDN